MLCSHLIFSCKLNKSLTLQLSLCVHENEDSALGEASSKTQETSKLCSEEKCHEWSGAVEGRGSYTNPFHLLIRKALLMSESSCTATSRNWHPLGTNSTTSARAGIYPKSLHASQILSERDLLVKNLKECRSQNLRFPTGHWGRKMVLGEAGLLWVPSQGI